jgi:hypothetical protein
MGDSWSEQDGAMEARRVHSPSMVVRLHLLLSSKNYEVKLKRTKPRRENRSTAGPRSSTPSYGGSIPSSPAL